MFIPSKNSYIAVIGRNSMIPFIAHGFLLKLLMIRRISIYSVFIGGLVFLVPECFSERA